MNERNMALSKSISKWEEIVSGIRSPLEGIGMCPLCSLFNKEIVGRSERSCTGCPLDIAGKDCLEKGSVWKQYDAHVNRKTNKDEDFGEDPPYHMPNSMKKLAKQMLKNLRAIPRDSSAVTRHKTGDNTI